MPTVTIDHTAIVDTRLRQDQPTTNFGGGVDMTATGKDFTGNKHVPIIAVDLTSRDPTDTCDSATLRLVTNNAATAGFTFEVHEILPASQGWTETGATWSTKNGTDAWAGGASGCFVAGTDYDATNLATDTYTANDPAGTELLFSLTPSVVESYFGSTMYLLVTKQGNGSNTAPALCSTEHATVANRPSLTITYTAVTDEIAPADPAFGDRSPTVLYVTAGYAEVAGSDAGAVATFEYSLNAGGLWVATQADDAVRYDRTANVAKVYISGLPPGATVHVRVTWSGVAISGTNPRYVGGGASPGTGVTMLSRRGNDAWLVNGTPQYQNARTGFHWTEHTDVPGASNLAADDYTTVAKQDVMFQNPPTNSTRRAYHKALRDTGLTDEIWVYRIYEIRTSGGVPVTLSTTVLHDDEARDEFIALLASDPDVILRDAGGNPLTRDEDAFVKWIPNLLNANFMAFAAWQHRRFDVAYFGTGLADSNHRADRVINDNWFIRRSRMELPVSADLPSAYASDFIMRQAYDGLTQLQQRAGSIVGANILVVSDTPASEIEEVGASLDLWWLENWGVTTYSGSTPSYRTLAEWNVTRQVTEAAWQAGRMVYMGGQMVDTSASYVPTADDVKQRKAIFWNYMICCDPDRRLVAFRSFDSSSNGTRRVREEGEWDAPDMGNPLDTSYPDTTSGTDPDCIWCRDTTLGVVYFNPTSSTKVSSLPGVGTLTAREGKFVSSATSPVAAAWTASWSARATTQVAKVATWDLRARAVVQKVASWSIRTTTSAQKVASWSARALATIQRVATWNVLGEEPPEELPEIVLVASWSVELAIAASSWPVEEVCAAAWSSEVQLRAGGTMVVEDVEFKVYRGQDRVLRFDLPAGAESWTYQFSASSYNYQDQLFTVADAAMTKTLVGDVAQVRVPVTDVQFDLERGRYRFSMWRVDAGFEQPVTVGTFRVLDSSYVIPVG